MKISSVYKILNSSNLMRNGNSFESKSHRFDVHTQLQGSVLFVRIIKKGVNGSVDYLNDIDSSIIVKTLKELRQRLSESSYL